MTLPTFINLQPNEYIQEFNYYPFLIKLDKYVGIFNTLNDLNNKVCVTNKPEEFNLRMFNMITGKNKSKTWTKHILCECKCKFDKRTCSSDQWWNNDKCRFECKERHVCWKDYTWNHEKGSCENRK